MSVAELKKIIREVPDYPKAGVTFYDLTTLFKNARALGTVIDRLAARFRGEPICFSTSTTMSFTRRRFAWVASSFASA